MHASLRLVTAIAHGPEELGMTMGRESEDRESPGIDTSAQLSTLSIHSQQHVTNHNAAMVR